MSNIHNDFSNSEETLVFGMVACPNCGLGGGKRIQESSSSIINEQQHTSVSSQS